jgi:hypothetical protein
MRIGTKSVIFGVHAILVHPFFVAYAWSRLFGFPWDPRLWVAFLAHDLGYIGKANMESSEGQQHVVLGGGIMGWLFGPFVVENKNDVLWRSPLCGAEPRALHQSLVALTFP